MNHFGTCSRWGFVGLKEVFQIDSEFSARVAAAVNEALEALSGVSE